MNVPLLVAGFTFLAVLLATSAVFLYVNSREVLQAWRRRADGTPLDKTEGSDSVTDQLMAQLHAVLEWFARMNQPSNVEEAKATRRKLISAGYRSGKAPVFYIGS